jgi:hypothetical protein
LGFSSEYYAVGLKGKQMKEQASEGTATKLAYGPAPKAYYFERCAGSFDFTGGSFVHEPVGPSGCLDAPIAPGSPRVAFWPCSATIQQNSHAKYVSSR